MTATRPVPLEREVQAWVSQVYLACGFTKWNLSQGFRPGGKRHATTRQTKGLPDLILTHPVRGILLFHEVKRLGGKQSDEQRKFQVHAEAAGAVYVLGGVDEAMTWLRSKGLVR